MAQPHVTVRLTNDEIVADQALAEVSDPTCGALNLFLGVTRNHHEGRKVKGLEYYCYAEMAQDQLQAVARDVAERHGISRLLVIHRLGPVGIGETSLLVAAGSHHRHQALAGTLDLIDRLKKDVPIWKREWFEDGTVGWVEGAQIVPSQL